MFSKNVASKAKMVYIRGEDDKIELLISLKSNHNISADILQQIEQDLKNIRIPFGYKLEVKD